MNDHCLVIFDQISYHCFHPTSSRSLRKNSKYQQVRDSLQTPAWEKPGVCFRIFLFWNPTWQEVTKREFIGRTSVKSRDTTDTQCAQRLGLCIIERLHFCGTDVPLFTCWILQRLLLSSLAIPWKPYLSTWDYPDLVGAGNIPGKGRQRRAVEEAISSAGEEISSSLLHEKAAEMSMQLLSLFGLCSCDKWSW